MLPIAVGSVEPLLDFRASMPANASDSAPTVSFLMPIPCSVGIFPALRGLRRNPQPRTRLLLMTKCEQERLDRMPGLRSGNRPLAR